MGPDPPIVVYDACVLYPFHLRNLLIELAVHGLVAARWTDTIHDEWIRNLAATRGIPHARLVMTRDLMKAVLPNANVQGWERLVGGLMLPDANDRHVLAAAIIAQASMILTWNTRHFPASALDAHRIKVLDPDSFLVDLCDRDPETITAVLDAARQICGERNPVSKISWRHSTTKA
jgi:predicted nucleic acid-binding protein